MYYALIYSTMTYGLEIYSNTNWENLRELDKIHKKLIKILFEIPIRTPTTEVYKNLGLLVLRHIIMLQLVKIGYGQIISYWTSYKNI